MSLRRYIFFIVLTICSFATSAQAPFNGLVVEQIPIPPAIAADIQADHNDHPAVIADPTKAFSSLPRCWRVYACQSDQDWELQAIFGLDYLADNFPLSLNTSTGFYQHDFALNSGLRDENPAILPFAPLLSYDSWITIGSDPRVGSNGDIATTSSLNQLSNIFEVQCSSFTIDDNVGTVLYSLVIPAPGVPSPGIPNADARVLFAQLTTDEVVTGNINLQYRFLNPDGSLYDPPGLDPIIVQVTNIPLDLTPGVLPIECSIQFLPVELTSFDAYPQETDVVIRWETASEKDNDYFIVQRSTDLQNWEDIGQIDGAGNSDLHRYYVTKDEKPIWGESYYRLKQVDFNGQSETHAPKTILFQPENGIEVYPNPAKDRISIDGLNDQVLQVELINAHGQIVKTWASTKEIRRELDLQQLTPGMYIVQIVFERGEAVRKRLVIQ